MHVWRGLSQGPLWSRPPMDRIELVLCSLPTLDNTMVLAQKQRPQSPHRRTACSLCPAARSLMVVARRVLLTSHLVVSHQRQEKDLPALPPCPTLWEVIGVGLQWSTLYMEALESCSPEKVRASSLPWGPVLLARCSMGCGFVHHILSGSKPKNTFLSQHCTHTPSLHPCCPLCLKTPLVGSKLPPPHCLTA